MMSVSAGPKADVPKSCLERALHICVLSAFAFSEPMFTILSQQLVFLHDLRVGWVEVGCLILILMGIVPAVWVLLDLTLVRLSNLWGGWGHDGIMLFLSFLVSLSILRPLMRIPFLISQASVWLATLIVAIPTSIFFTIQYRRSRWLRQWILVASIGLVCFPSQFVWRIGKLRQVDALHLDWPTGIPRAKNPIPVIFVVFDEFSGTTLMNRSLDLDAEHFPQFARLGKLSTWYRQATTVHGRTDVAVPAILSAQLPVVKRPALESEFPGNLLRTIHATSDFELVAFEPITRLCPQSARVRDWLPKTLPQKINTLVRTLTTVYPRLILPDDTPIEFPRVSRIWFGLPEGQAIETEIMSGLIHHLPFHARDSQLQQFIDCIHPASELPQFCFLHVELPHLPWCFLPSGHYYNWEHGEDFNPPGSHGDLGEDWNADPETVGRNEHRYLLQVGFVDRFIGQLLDRLQQTGILDQCLLIVTADHGVSIRPSHSRRVPDNETLADILSVPLFIKYPGQSTGKIDDGNAESIDILPTVAEILGLPLSEPTDGVTLTTGKRRQRKSFYGDRDTIILGPMLPGLRAAVQRRWSIFGEGPWERPPLITASHPDWHGRPLRDFAIENRPLEGVLIERPTRSQEVGESKFAPCLVRGYINGSQLPSSTAELVMTVNDVVCDTGHTYRHAFNSYEFGFLIPEAVISQPPGDVSVFLVVDDKSSTKVCLRPVASYQLPVQ